MKIDRDVAVHLKEVGKHTVIEFRARICRKLTAPMVLPILKHLPSRKSKEVGAMKSLLESPVRATISKEKWKRLIGVHIEHIMKHFQPFVAGQRLGFHAESFEVVEDVGFNAFELRLCRAEGVRLNAEGDVLLLDQPVVALVSWFCSIPEYSERMSLKASSCAGMLMRLRNSLRLAF